MFVYYLFGLSIGVLLPVAAYLLFGRGKPTSQRPQPAISQSFDGESQTRQLGRAVLSNEGVMASPDRGATPRRLSFSSALKASSPMQRSSPRTRTVLSPRYQIVTRSPLASPNRVTRSSTQTAGSLVDYVTKTRLKKSHELARSPVMVRVKPSAPPPVKRMNEEVNPSNREIVLSALKQKTRRKRAISPDNELPEDQVVSAAKRKRPPESVGQGTKRQAGGAASDEGVESVPKRSRNFSSSTNATQTTDKGQKRAASPAATLSVNKRPVTQQHAVEETTKAGLRAKNRFALDDDVIMQDVSTTSSKTPHKRSRGTKNDDQHDQKSMGTKSTGARPDASKPQSKEKKRRRKSGDQQKPAMQVFESTIPVYSPGLREGVALRRHVSLRGDLKDPLPLPSQLTKGKKYSKEDIEHDRQAAHSRVEYLLAEDEEEEEADQEDKNKKEPGSQLVDKDDRDTANDEPDGEDGTKKDEGAIDLTDKEPEKPPGETHSASNQNKPVTEKGKNEGQVPTSASTGLKLGAVGFKLSAPPSYDESVNYPLVQGQAEKQEEHRHSVSLPQLGARTATGSLEKPPISTELLKPSPLLAMSKQDVASQQQQPKPTISFQLSTKPSQPVTTSLALSQSIPSFSVSTGSSSVLSSTGFNMPAGISFGSTATPQAEKASTSAAGHDMGSPMSDDDMGGATQPTGASSQDTTSKGQPTVSFNLMPGSQAKGKGDTEPPKFSFGVPSAHHKDQGSSEQPKMPFSFLPSGQPGMGQKIQETNKGSSLSFGLKPNRPSEGNQQQQKGGLFDSFSQNQGSSFTVGATKSAQSTPSSGFSFALNSQTTKQPTGSAGMTFQFGSQKTQQSTLSVPSLGSIGGNRSTNQAIPSTFNFALAVTTSGQSQTKGLGFGTQQLGSSTPPTFGAQSSTGFTGNQSFSAGQGDSTQSGLSVGFTLGSSSSTRRPVARPRRRTQGKPR